MAAALEATTPTPVLSVDHAVYLLSSVRTASIRSATLGDDIGVDLPGPVDVSCFCLAGIGIVRPCSWHEDIERRLPLDGPDGRAVLRRLARAADEQAGV